MSYHLINAPGERHRPFQYQHEYHEYMSTHTKEKPARAVCVWPRRHGKDLTALKDLLSKAHDEVGLYWHGLPTYEQARKSVWMAFHNELGRRLMDNVFPRELVKRPGEWAPQAEMLVELKNGSLVQFVGADSVDRLVGAGIRGLNASEFALWRPSAFDLISPMLEETHGWASFLFTPRGHNHAYDLFRNAVKNHWFVSHKTILNAGKYTPEQAVALVKRELERGMLPELVQQEYFCDFAAAMVGSYWGDALHELEQRGQVDVDFEHGRDLVNIVVDLGMNDMFAIWAYRVTSRGVEFVAHYENHNQPLEHYFNILDGWRRDLGFSYKDATFWLPHDARVRTLVTGETVAEKALHFARERNFGCQVDIAPDIGLLSGIEAARALLLTDVWFHKRCNERDGKFGREGIEALRQYHREYDEDRRVFLLHPEHDWSSHTADAFRYGAVTMRITRDRIEALAPKAERPVPPTRAIYIGTAPDLRDVADEPARRERI